MNNFELNYSNQSKILRYSINLCKASNWVRLGYGLAIVGSGNSTSKNNNHEFVLIFDPFPKVLMFSVVRILFIFSLGFVVIWEVFTFTFMQKHTYVAQFGISVFAVKVPDTYYCDTFFPKTKSIVRTISFLLSLATSCNRICIIRSVIGSYYPKESCIKFCMVP